jgi:hypothetical protein
MPARIELVNVSDLAPVKMTQVEQAAWLETLSITEYYSVGSGKGGRVMVRPEDAEAVRQATPPGRRSRERTLKIESRPYPIVQPIRDDVALEAWKASVEEMVLEQEGRVDQLHKAVESMNQVYVQLRAATTLELPEAPKLPTKYRFRVVIVGGDARYLPSLEQQFKEVRFLQAGGFRGKGQGRVFPQADLALLLVKFTSHQEIENARNFYGAKAQMIPSGGLSTLQAVLEMWLRDNRKDEGVS